MMEINRSSLPPHTALILIDLQQDYFPGGAFPLVDAEAAVCRAAEVLAMFRASGAPVLHIQHTMLPERGQPFFLAETPGHAFHPAVEPTDGEPVIVKHLPDAFAETELADQLHARRIKHLILVGMMTQVCVAATTHSGFQRGFDVTVVGDATAARDLLLDDQLIPAETVRLANLASLQGVFARVESTAGLLARLDTGNAL